MKNPIILTTIASYLPGFKAGGPIRTLTNLIARLGDEFDFRILTADRDLDDVQPYPDIQPNVWMRRTHEWVCYLSPDQRKFLTFRHHLTQESYDLLYLNSFFSQLTVHAVTYRRLGLLPARPWIIAPRGEFSPGALRIKWPKKRLFLIFAGISGLYRNLIWQASSEFEAADIRKLITRFHLDSNPTILVAPNLPPEMRDAPLTARPPKTSGSARLVFLSRIARMKNLAFALQQLAWVQGEVSFDIYGPKEDEAYWRTCQQHIASLPENVTVSYLGPVEPDQASTVFASYHAFLFPTLGENFGHVILESLSAGCPVITSDRTPWRGLESKQAGWDLPLERPDAFVRAIQQIIDMDQPTWQKWAQGARLVAREFINDPAILEANRQLFYTALAQKRMT